MLMPIAFVRGPGLRRTSCRIEHAAITLLRGTCWTMIVRTSRIGLAILVGAFLTAGICGDAVAKSHKMLTGCITRCTSLTGRFGTKAARRLSCLFRSNRPGLGRCAITAARNHRCGAVRQSNRIDASARAVMAVRGRRYRKAAGLRARRLFEVSRLGRVGSSSLVIGAAL